MSSVAAEGGDEGSGREEPCRHPPLAAARIIWHRGHGGGGNHVVCGWGETGRGRACRGDDDHLPWVVSTTAATAAGRFRQARVDNNESPPFLSFDLGAGKVAWCTTASHGWGCGRGGAYRGLPSWKREEVVHDYFVLLLYLVTRTIVAAGSLERYGG